MSMPYLTPQVPVAVHFYPARLHAAVQFHAVDVDDTFKCISAFKIKYWKKTNNGGDLK